MTNREWLMKELANMSDEKLAGVFLEYNPTCSDDYGWVDRYTNPFDRKYDIYQRKDWGWGMQTVKEELFETDYDKAIKDFVVWLNEEHKGE